MPTFRIDDRELTVPDGTTVLQAALANGIEIPHYCYHPGLSIAGNCRICLVDIEKFPKPAIACNTVVTEGMVVHSHTDHVREMREAVMEYFLVNHPLDCPICDQAGECKLQDYSYRFGYPTTRFTEEKEHGPKRRVLGPHVVFDWERCIKCTRCIRFCDEVTQTGELDMFLRGVREEIGVFPGKPLDNPYSGCVVDLCPVGALTLREFRFRSRVWFLTNVPTTCAACARGCSTLAASFRNELFRITPRENQAVNRWWMCDVGRLWGHALQASEERRLDGAHMAESGLVDWDVAVGAARDLLAETRPGRVRLVASPRATLEEAWALARLSQALGGAPVHLPVHEEGEDDGLLIRADKSPNRRGVTAVLEAMAGGARTIEELEGAIGDLQVDVLLALGPGLVGPVESEPPAIEPHLLARVPQRIVLDAYPSALSGAATILLPVACYGEVSGAYVNFAGRVQHAERCLQPKVDCRPATMVLLDLVERLGAGPVPSPSGVRAQLSNDVPAFADIRWAERPASTGQDRPGADAAAQACPATGAALKMLSIGMALAGNK